MPRRPRIQRIVIAILIAGSSTGCQRSRSVPPEPPRYALHEWGLIAVDANEPSLARVATEVAGGMHLAEAPQGTSVRGFGFRSGYGGKPVIYVHLEPGVSEASFDLRLGIPSSGIVERWPPGGELGSTDASGWRHVVARRGACTSPTAPPTATSGSCTHVRDGFCEAAEIPRYSGSHASCLEVGASRSELLFYRAEGIPTDPLPVRMVRAAAEWNPERVHQDRITGPIFFVTAANGGREVAVYLLEENALRRDWRVTGVGSRPVDPSTAKDLIRFEAIQRGLSESEADAFADAWAPAVFARCSREGPEAAGTLPSAFEQSTSSLIYFAPTAVVDAMIPLTATPPPARVHRAFLVRFVDGQSTIHREDARRISEELASRDPSQRFFDPDAPAPQNLLLIRPAGTATAQGGLTSDQFRRIVQRHVMEVVPCGELAAGDDPDYSGRIDLHFRIGGDGLVDGAEVDGAPGRRSRTCFERVIRRWAFPVPPDGRPTTAMFPLVVFRGGSE